MGVYKEAIMGAYGATTCVSTSMSRNNRSNKRRRSQAFPAEDEIIEHSAAASDSQNINNENSGEGDDAQLEEAEKVVDAQPGEEEQPEESEEELKRKHEMWDAFQEEHHEGMY